MLPQCTGGCSVDKKEGWEAQLGGKPELTTRVLMDILLTPYGGFPCIQK